MTEINPPVNVCPTELTVPPPVPAGVAQVPSPRQNVVDDAEVPEFRFVTGKFPVTPVESGRPVALVRTSADGVPRAGVTNVGDVPRTFAPEPVDVVTPVPPFVTPSVPVTPVVSGRPVALVNVAADGVPIFGVMRAGLVERTIPPVPVTVLPSAVITPEPVEIVEGGDPAPPPITRAFATRTADDAQDEAELKYGMPPLVPATVNARVPDVVTGDPPTEINPPVKDAPTEVTVPVPAAAHVPSPRQNVELVAPVPEFRFPTARFPVTPVERGKPVAFVNIAAEGVPSAGVTKTGDVARAIDPEPVTFSPSAVWTPDPRELIPVPPFAVASIPARVRTPDEVTGPPVKNRPVVPPLALTDVTVPLPPSARMDATVAW